MNNQLQSSTVFFVVLAVVVVIVDKYLSLQVRVVRGVDSQSDVFLKYVVHTLYCTVVLISLMIMPPLHFLHRRAISFWCSPSKPTATGKTTLTRKCSSCSSSCISFTRRSRSNTATRRRRRVCKRRWWRTYRRTVTTPTWYGYQG